jgi:predicted RecB family nuclease
MSTTSHLFESFLDCPTKCFLRAHAEVGSTDQYATWLNSYKSTYRNHSLQRLQENLPKDACLIDPPSEKELNSSTWLLAVNVPACTQNLATQIQAIERVPSLDPSKPGELIPIRFVCFNKLSKNDRLLLTFDALVLSKVTGREITVGKIIHGDNHTTLKSKTANLLDETCNLIGKTTALVVAESAPDLILNRHCNKCEFHATCRRKALEKDDLSLLAGMTEKERRKHHRRGIFTVTQLSYTFRPRRTPKRVTTSAKLHYFSLQALALKETKVYVNGNNVLPEATTHVYLDIEGLPDRNSYYLIGALIATQGRERFTAFWAENESDQANIFSHFVESMSSLHDFRVYHYGNYEKVALKQLIPQLPQHLQEVARTMLANSVNVASFLYSHIYFPVYSNGLKQVAAYLGHTWSIPESSGLQSIAWRMQWEQSHEHALRRFIESYNHDDCTALRTLVYFITNLPRHDDLTSAPSSDQQVAFTENIAHREDRHEYSTNTISPIDGYADIIRYAYFDYQRTKVYVRTYPRLRRINRRIARKSNVPAFRPNVRIELRAHQCSYCDGRNLLRDNSNYHAIKAFISMLTHPSYIV